MLDASRVSPRSRTRKRVLIHQSEQSWRVGHLTCAVGTADVEATFVAFSSLGKVSDDGIAGKESEKASSDGEESKSIG